MRIVVNDIAASKGGAMTILRQFYQYVRENDTENEWIFMLGEKCLEETENIKVHCFPDIKASRAKKLLFDCFFGRKTVNGYKPDVVVSLQNIVTFGVKAPQVVYIHQSIPFQKIKRFSFFKSSERSLAVVQHIIGFLIKLSAKKADKVFVQTEWMRAAVSEGAGIPKEKVLTAFPEIELFKGEKKTSSDSKRFFYPTGKAIYKNIGLIVNACNMLNAEGVCDFRVRLTLPEGAVKHKNVECIDYVDREQLELEYRSGTLIFPSYIETVGLPLLEARSCNTAILASDMPFSHECLEGYRRADYFNPFNARELKDLMLSVMQGTADGDVEPPCETVAERKSWKDFYQTILTVKK